MRKPSSTPASPVRPSITADPDVLRIHEAAAFLGAHEQTVRRLARRGAIPCFKVGKDWRFRREALVRWSEQQQPPAAARSRVLVVDDEASVVRILRRTLEAIGCQVRVAGSGVEGLERVRDERPDLILLDLTMPGMNGPQFLAELRKTEPDLPVVIVTGFPDSDLMRQAMQHAPLLVLAKPVASELLQRTVQLALGQAALARGI